mgnify:CR=1 FL=1
MLDATAHMNAGASCLAALVWQLEEAASVTGDVISTGAHNAVKIQDVSRSSTAVITNASDQTSSVIVSSRLKPSLIA